MHSFSAEWQPTSMAPSDRELEICVLDYDGIVHTFPLACHKDGPSWVDARGKRHVDIQPTHWRNWSESTSRRAEQPRPSGAADRYDTDEPLGPEGIARLVVPEGAA